MVGCKAQRLALAVSLVLGTFSQSVNAATWQPKVGSAWQIVLAGNIDVSATMTKNVPIVDIDLFSNTNNGKDPQSIIGNLHKAGKKVICYFSAGTYEPYRPDSTKFNSLDLGAALPAWPDERWLDIRSERVRTLLRTRIYLAYKMGCDAIDPDNMDGYDNENGGGFDVPLTEKDSVDLIRMMATYAAKLGMSIGLKNALSIIPDVLDVVQFAVNESCARWSECQELQAFIQAGKPVFHIEYPRGAGTISGVPVGTRKAYCQAPGTSQFSTVLKTGDLNGWTQLCSGQVFRRAIE